MDKQLFDNAIGATPPSTVDVDAVIASQRRAARVRRVAGPGVVAVAAVVAVTFGATYALSGAGSTGDPAAPGGPPPSAASAQDRAEPAEPTCGPPPTEPIEDAEARLTAVLTSAVEPLLPADATLEPHPGARYSATSSDGHGPLEVYHVLPEDGDDSNLGTPDCDLIEDMFLHYATVVDPAGTGSIHGILMRLAPNSVATVCAGPEVDPNEVACDVSTGPNGERVVASTSVLQQGGTTSYRVDVAKRDGTAVILSADNSVLGGKASSPPERPEPPLTMAQLVGIALDPGLTLYPPA